MSNRAVPVYALLRLGAILAVGTAVAACGGGSGGSGPTPVNAPLTVDAGAGQTVEELTEVALSGSVRDADGTIRSYRWTQVAGPNVDLVDADTAEASFIAPDGSGGSAELIFRLTVTGDSGETASDEVTVTVNFRNSPPTVDAGTDQTVAERTEIALSGSAQDEDGTIQSYRWTQVAGPNVDLVDADSAAVRFTTPDGLSGSAELVFRLTVSDDSGVTASDDVIITVAFANNPPIVRSVGHHTVRGGNFSNSIAMLAEDTDGAIESYEWTQVSGPAVAFRWEDAYLYYTSPSGMADGASDSVVLVFRLTVTDDQGATATGEVTITALFYNSLPIVDAGADQSVSERARVTLSGNAKDADGTIESIQWTQISGPPVPLSDSDTLFAGFTAPDAPSGAADLAFRLTVVDDDGATAIDEVRISVISNSPPSADAGADSTVAERASVAFSGRAEDADGTIESIQWTQVSGPSVEILAADALFAGFTAPALQSGAVNLVFRLTVADDRGAVANDEVTVTVVDDDAVRVSGRITFDYVPAVRSEGLQYWATEQRPVRGVTVELRESTDERLVDVAVTDQNGDYAVYAPTGATVYVRVRAEIPDESGSWDVRVVNSDDGVSGCGTDTGYALYAMDSSPFTASDTTIAKDFRAASGWTGTGYGEARVAAPFAILDVILDAMQFVRSGVGSTDFRPLLVYWGSRNTGAYHSSCQDKSIINLSGVENENTDEYDRTLIAHEWGHYFQASFSRNDSLGGPHDALYDHFELATAFSEGFASALGALVTNDPVFTLTFGPQQSRTSGFSVETVTHTVRGWFNEASIAQIVYDLVDPVNDDTVELGFRPIFDVLANEFSETRSLTSIFSFIHALKNRVPEYALAIDAVVGYHRIQPIIDEWGSTETNAGRRAIPEVLPVYSELTVNAGPVNGCSVDSYGAIRTGRYNKLGIRRYIRFRAESEGEYMATATLTSAPPEKQAWPVLRLKTAGRDGSGNAVVCAPEDLGNCTLTAVLHDVPAGDNVLALWDEGNSQTADPNRGKKCFDVEITSR